MRLRVRPVQVLETPSENAPPPSSDRELLRAIQSMLDSFQTLQEWVHGKRRRWQQTVLTCFARNCEHMRQCEVPGELAGAVEFCHERYALMDAQATPEEFRKDWLADNGDEAVDLSDARRCCHNRLRGLTPESPPPPRVTIECHVTLSQMAGIVSKSKKTLERLKQAGKLPTPTVKGGKGKANEWPWSQVRPVLEKEYARELP